MTVALQFRPLVGQETRRILVLYEPGLASSAVALVDVEIQDIFEKQSTYQIDFYMERALPVGSVVLSRQLPASGIDRAYVWAGIFLMLAESLLIVQLLKDRLKQRGIEARFRESQAHLEEAQSIAKYGSWDWDPVRDEFHWSDEMYHILGVVPQSVVPTCLLLHPVDHKAHAARMKAAFNTGHSYTTEYAIRRPDGEMRMVVESGRTKCNPEQRPASLIGTLLDITEVQREEEVLRDRELRFRTLADLAPVMMWTSGIDKLCTDFNRGWLMFTGRPIEQELGEGWAQGVHGDDLQRCMSIYVESFDQRQTFTMDYRLRRYDGEYRWISDAGSPRFLPDGTFVGYIGYCVDIHDRKQAELARLELAGRLMNAQEAERARIARELHDGIGQQIALLGIQMQRAAGSASQETGPLHVAIKNLCTQLAAIGLEVSHLSHQLHSSQLEILGLSAALKELCRQFSDEHRIKVDCDCKSIPTELDKRIALNILRVVQESLHNVARHSKAKTVQVEVFCQAEQLVLTVRDSGVGFNVHSAGASAGLGLVSMRERIALIGGELAVDSRLGLGTTIRVQVPL